MAVNDLHRPVGRPREFDEEKVLDAAMDAFWNKGYEATSLADLCRCTGLNKGSLYKAFGDKHRLFMRSLQRYAEQEYREVMAAVSLARSPLDKIRAAIRKVSEDAGHGKGCLMINSMVELAPHDPEVRAALQSFAEKRLRGLTEMIGAAQQCGELRTELDPYALARQLLITLAGAATMSKGFIANSEISDTLEDLIDSWT